MAEEKGRHEKLAKARSPTSEKPFANKVMDANGLYVPKSVKKSEYARQEWEKWVKHIVGIRTPRSLPSEAPTTTGGESRNLSS
jgi:hypothetical protein